MITLGTISNSLKVGVIDLIKMDIEGPEYQVICRSDEADFKNIRNLVLEVHYHHNSRESREIIRKLRSLGFKTRGVSLTRTRIRFRTYSHHIWWLYASRN